MTKKKRDSHSSPNIRLAKRALSRQLLQYSTIAGVGIDEDANGQERIKVYVTEDTPHVRALVPESVEGYPVVLEAIGSVVPRGQSTAEPHLGQPMPGVGEVPSA